MIFDTTDLDNQIAALTAERDRKNEANLIAEQLQSGLSDLLELLKGDQDAIAILKAELLEMFPVEDCETAGGQEIEVQPGIELSGTPTHNPQPEESISDRVREAKGEYYQLIQTTNPAIAYFKRYDAQLGHVYVGGMTQSRLQAWGDWLHANGYVTHPPILREAKRLSNWTYELKLPPIPREYLDDLIAADYTRYPTPSFQVLAA